MQSVPRIAVSLFLLTSALASANHNTAKLRRDGVLNLYPFPRVGRASHRTWQVPLDDFYLSKVLEYGPLAKRQMYAFPRVGRNDPALLRMEPLGEDQMSAKHDRPSMWFGPRLGRSFKSEDDDVILQNENERSEPEQIDPERTERVKRDTTNNNVL